MRVQYTLVHLQLLLQLYTLHKRSPTHWHVIVKTGLTDYTGSLLPRCLLSESQDLMYAGKNREVPDPKGTD